MMKLHSPQLVSLSEASLLQALMSETRRPNLLVVCRRVSVEAAARHIVSYCAPPFHTVSLPGPLDLSGFEGGTLVLADVAMMSLGQQMRLYDWLTATVNCPQVVSISSVPLRPLVDDGRFLEGLLYRLNLIYLDATPCETAAGLLPGNADQNLRQALPFTRSEGLMQRASPSHIAQFA
jgi:transcriptional regulator of acetoin/glycerol metabolism